MFSAQSSCWTDGTFITPQRVLPPSSSFLMAGPVTDSIVILDDDDDEEQPSTSAACSQFQKLQKEEQSTRSPQASTQKNLSVLEAENQKLFAEFVDHCGRHAQGHPEVITFLQTRHAKALPSFLCSVELRNTLSRCLTRAQDKPGKTFVFINELCTVLKQHTARKRSSLQTLSTPRSNGTEEPGEPQREEEEESVTKTKKASRRQVAYLENLLKVYNEEIQRLQERELDLDDLEKEDSSYIQEHQLKRKMMKIYEKLCELKDCSPLLGRVIEQKIRFSGTRYPEVNKKVERFINSAEALHNPPDYTDILRVVQRANERHKLMLTRKQQGQVAQEAFRETGNKLQERRHLDMVYNFGSHLTDAYRPTLDPALTDSALNRKLRCNRDVALSSLEEVISKYANRQEDAEEEESRRRQERERQKREALNGPSEDKVKEEAEEREKEKEEEDEEDEEEDESSDPDIEEEIQASQRHTGPGDDDDDDDEEEEGEGEGEEEKEEVVNGVVSPSAPGSEELQSPVSSTSEAAGKTPPLTEPNSQSEPADSSDAVKLEHAPSDQRDAASGSVSNGVETAVEVSTRSATCSPIRSPSPLLIDESGHYKKRKRRSSGGPVTSYNGKRSKTGSSEISADQEVICTTRSDTPPPKKNKVNVATQYDPEEVIVLSDSD